MQMEPEEGQQHIEGQDSAEEAVLAAPEAEPAIQLPDVEEVEEAEREIHRMSRRSFLWAGAAVIAGFSGWHWLASKGANDDISRPLRSVLETNEKVSRALYNPARLAPEFPKEAAREPRENGLEGMDGDIDEEEWKLTVEGVYGANGPKQISLAEIKKMPQTEIVTELKCIEGWSVVVRWKGVRLSDFAKVYPPITRSGKAPDLQGKPNDLVGYVSLETPDKGYYVGLDMESALHPQTLLCYEMNGEPLSQAHGAPLRLAIPVKYGIKNIKRIGTLRYTDARPADYWAERGYDWYAGH
jgi:DMSO/TMAO reductase YedYZ molybdopterin-dependent catalytic subunit